MSEERRGFLSQIRGCITSPRKTFETIRGGDVWKGVLLILILTTISAWTGYNYSSKLPVTIPEGFTFPSYVLDPEVFRKNIMTLYTLRDGLRVISGWLIPSVLLHLFASFTVGKGSFRRTMALTGFASIPLIFQQLLRLVDAYTISSETFLSVSVARTLGQTFILRLMEEALSVFTIFGLWALALTVVAVTINYNTTTKRAAFTVARAYLVLILIRTNFPL